SAPPAAHAPLTLPPITIEAWRGEVLESVHRAHAVMLDEEGRVLARAGDPDLRTSARSAIKPFQAWASLRRGLRAALALTPDELALMCASHGGEEEHVATCERLLAKLKRDLSDLECGAHDPYHEPTARALLAAGRAPTAAHNNCSGKHCGMLALAAALGVESAGYTHPDHPVQREVLGALRELLGGDPRPLRLGVDGCSLPTPELSLRELAALFARLAAARRAPGAPRDEALDEIFAAMVAHPHLVAGSGRFDTALMTRFGDEVVCKVGGEALHGLALRPRGAGAVGVAVKVEDGAMRAINPATLCFLEAAGVLDRARLDGAVARFVAPAVRSCRGAVVGELRARLG
ncbi:MAG: asparaginase, partial [Deltaproteobacteria bacterium]|nr:asparaginase [Deltaproteobacteria bacterium]